MVSEIPVNTVQALEDLRNMWAAWWNASCINTRVVLLNMARVEDLGHSWLGNWDDFSKQEQQRIKRASEQLRKLYGDYGARCA